MTKKTTKKKPMKPPKTTKKPPRGQPASRDLPDAGFGSDTALADMHR